MKQVYKCEYCRWVFDEDKSVVEKHEEECGGNPKNKITDETLIKLSRLRDIFDDVVTYLFLTKYKDKRIFFKDELERANNKNCPASVYEQSNNLRCLLGSSWRIQREDLKWFLSITERDYKDIIEAVIKYLEE